MSNNPQFNTYYHPADVKLPERKAPAPKPKKRRRWLKWLLITLAVLFAVVLASGVYVGWKFFKDSSKVFGGSTFSNAIKAFEPTTLKGQGSRNTNILITGNSIDDPGHPAADLTDSIMILSLDVENNKATLISIPRDLYINIPGYGHRKINEAYHWGEEDGFSETGYPAGGVGLLEKTITTNMEVPIDYYLLVNYAAIRNVVNVIGGVDVNIQSSDPRGLYDPNISPADGGPLQLANGVQHLDGQTALNFARARGDPTASGQVGYGFAKSDFDRAEHQRQLLAATQKKVLSTSVLLNPIRIGQIFDALANNIQTDLQINEARKVVGSLRHIGDSLESQALTNDKASYLRSYATPKGQSALIPTAGIDNYTAIQAFLRTLTNNPN